MNDENENKNSEAVNNNVIEVIHCDNDGVKNETINSGESVKVNESNGGNLKGFFIALIIILVLGAGYYAYNTFFVKSDDPSINNKWFKCD